MNRKTVSSLVIACLLLAGSLFPQSMLESIKKGNRGDKSWAVFAFDKKAVWIGLSQDDAGQITRIEIDAATVSTDEDVAILTLCRDISERRWRGGHSEFDAEYGEDGEDYAAF